MKTTLLKKPVFFTKKYFSRENLNITSLLGFYRYASLFVTAIFYFIKPGTENLFFIIGIVIILLVEAYIFIKVYNNKNTTKILKYSLIIVETFGLLILLIFTGGISSPFLWYFLNPILLSILLQPFYFCWIVLAIFATPIVLFSRFGVFTGMGFDSAWSGNSFFILVFILVILAAQLYSYLIKKLSKQTESLKEYVNALNELYESTEIFSLHNNIQSAINIFAAYGKKLTDAQKTIISIETCSKNKKRNYFTVRGSKSVLNEENWSHALEGIHSELNNNENNFWVFKIKEEDSAYNMISVRISSKTNVFGLLSAFYKSKIDYNEKILPTLKLLSNLCAEFLEKHNLEILEEEFLVREEKDRIAGEIHDNVSQDLFALVCGLDLLDKSEKFNSFQHKKIKMLQDTAQRCIRQLRYSIYDLSSTKKNCEPLVSEVKKHLDNLGCLNNIKVAYKFKGRFTSLNYFYRKCLIRIIREATGNAIRHGGCSRIEVSLTLDDCGLILSVTDNGCGFNVRATEKECCNGLGLINIKELVRNMNGYVSFNSEINKGTSIICEIPLKNICSNNHTKERLYA